MSTVETQESTIEQRVEFLERAFMEFMNRHLLHEHALKEGVAQFTRDTAHLTSLQKHVADLHSLIEDHKRSIAVFDATAASHQAWLAKQPGTVMLPKEDT